MGAPFYLFPPHPHTTMKIPHADVGKYEEMGGWVAQRKYNGSHLVGHLYDNILTIWNRQGIGFTTYKLTPEMTQAFGLMPGVDPSVEYVFDGELLHTKAKLKTTNEQAAANTIVLFDLLYAGRLLLTESFTQRYEMLREICGNPTQLEPKKRALEVSQVNESKVWLAEVFPDDFSYHFYEFYEFTGANNDVDLFPEIEGLVLKRAGNSPLESGKKAYDVNWMMRVRKPKPKTYQW